MKNLILCLVLFFTSLNISAFASTQTSTPIPTKPDTLSPEVVTAMVGVLAIPGAGEAEVVIVVAGITALILTYGIVETVKDLCAAFAGVEFVKGTRMPGSKCTGSKVFILAGAPDILVTVLGLLPGVCVERDVLFGGDVYVTINI